MNAGFNRADGPPTGVHPPGYSGRGTPVSTGLTAPQPASIRPDTAVDERRFQRGLRRRRRAPVIRARPAANRLAPPAAVKGRGSRPVRGSVGDASSVGTPEGRREGSAG